MAFDSVSSAELGFLQTALTNSVVELNSQRIELFTRLIASGLTVSDAGVIAFGSSITISAAAITSGTLAVARGGTNIGTYAIGDLLYADTTGSLAKLADVATGNALISGGVGAAPSWGKVALTTHVSGTLPVANGGTGQTTAVAAFDALSPLTTQGDLLYNNGTNDTRLAKDANATRYLANTGTDNNPAWNQVNLADGVTGTLPVGNGGTGATTFTDAGVLIGNSTGAIQVTSAGTSGQVLTSNGAGVDPTFQAAAASGPPRLTLSTVFEATGRFTETVVSGGVIAYGTNGADLTSSGTISSSAQLLWHVVSASNNGGLFTVFPTEWNVSLWAADLSGTDFQMFAGLGAPTVGGAGITYTVNHIGFKITRAASGAINLVATQADGTETVSSTLTTVATNDSLDLSLSVDSATSVRYWWRKNGGAWSSATTLTANVPTVATVKDVSLAVSNAGVATSSNFISSGMTVVR